MAHEHHHGGDHDHGSGSRRRLVVVLAMVLGYMVAEVIGGLLSGSLALIADAGHMLSDAGALVITLAASQIARRPASITHTFGYHRAEILGALLNGVALVAIALYVVVGAYGRIAEPVEVAGGTMLGVAAGGLLVNLISLRLLHADASHNLNIRGAWLHVMADTAGSVGAVIAGGVILAFGWHWADPAVSVMIACLVLLSAYALLRQAVDVLMQAVPAGVDLAELESAVAAIDGVVAVHDLHVWSVTRARSIMSAHVDAEPKVDRAALLAAIKRAVGERFGLEHLTIQIDCPDDCEPCEPAPTENGLAETNRGAP